MQQEFISLDERLNQLRANDSSIAELFEKIGMLNVKEISYYKENGKYNQDTVLVGAVLEEAGLDSKWADEICIEDFFLIMARAMCECKEKEFQAKKAGIKEGEYTKEVYLYLLVKTLYDSRDKNELIKKMMKLSLKEVGRYACYVLCEGDEEILKQLEDLDNFDWGNDDYSKLEVSDKVSRYQTIYSMIKSNSDMTVEEYLTTLKDDIHMFWNPTSSFEAYKQRMLNTYNKIYYNFFYRFVEVFRKGRRVDTIIDKYK